MAWSETVNGQQPWQTWVRILDLCQCKEDRVDALENEIAHLHGRPPAPRWQSIPRAGIHALLRLVQKRWPPEPPAASPGETLCRSMCNEYREWLHVQRGLAKASIRALMWEGRHFLSWYAARSPIDDLRELIVRDIDIYFEMRAAGLRRRSLKDVTERLRSLLRFLHRRGRIGVDLAPNSLR